MNARKNVTCVESNGFGFGTMSGYGINGHEIQPCRHVILKSGRWAMMRHSLYGRTVSTYEEARKLGIEAGILHYYGRNTCGFVQSRAARRRGYVTTDHMYLRRMAEAAR